MGRYYIKTSVFSYKKGKKMIKIGIIGLGRIGKVHIKSISTKIGSAKVVAAADPFLNDEMTAYAKEFGIENLSKDSLTPKMSESAQENEIKEINLKLLNGTTMQITKRSNGFDVKDGKKATLYVFFATWCPPCKAEIPHLNNLSEKFKNELDIVGVLLEDKSEIYQGNGNCSSLI